MENERPVDRLSRYLIHAGAIAIIAALCWYFRSVLLYVILAAVVALVGKPVFAIIEGISVKGKRLPAWAASALTIIFIFAVLIGIVTTVVPVISSVAKDISAANVTSMAQALGAPLASLNQWLIHSFPGLGRDFRVESFVISELQELVDFGKFSSVVGSLASFVASLAVTIFAMVFISFFFIKDPSLLSKILCAFVPDRHEDNLKASLNEMSGLVSRYFVGLILEVIGVSVLNFLGLWLVARMGFRYSIGIAFMMGMLNIVPYVGPLIGGVIGVTLSLTIKYACATSFGLAVSFPVFLAVLIAIFVFTQLVDNYFFQPFIYSNSVKAHPLEIFIVLLMAGHIGGIVGMLAAIPAYTVARVIARHFFSDVKAIGLLTGDSNRKK